jgi:decaprenyl-phosphate phosphoribosyltransferase
MALRPFSQRLLGVKMIIETIENAITTDVATASPTGEMSVNAACQNAHARQASWAGMLLDYASIARPDHWLKNVFMLIGVALAYFYKPELFWGFDAAELAVGFFATCFVASSNYVLNEILDAPTDANHPEKHQRPIPSGRVWLPAAYVEWLLLGALGFTLAWLVNVPFFLAAVTLWVMGLIYNVRPIRSKELPYVDVLSESVNNPLRLLLGWFVVSAVSIPPVSLLVSYWMVGAFFMGAKRFAEYRSINHKERAAAYRKSFRFYNADRLLVSMFFYASAAAMFLGIFIIRYHLELILSVPLIAGFFSMYLRVSLKDNSAAQAPERLFKEAGLMVYLVACLAVFVLLMFVRINVLYEWFNVIPSDLPPLWEL